MADLGRTPLLARAVEVALVRASEPLAVAAVPARVAPAALAIDAHAVVGAGAVLVLDVGIVRAVDAARRGFDDCGRYALVLACARFDAPDFSSKPPDFSSKHHLALRNLLAWVQPEC